MGNQAQRYRSLVRRRADRFGADLTYENDIEQTVTVRGLFRAPSAQRDAVYAPQGAQNPNAVEWRIFESVDHVPVKTEVYCLGRRYRVVRAEAFDWNGDVPAWNHVLVREVGPGCP